MRGATTIQALDLKVASKVILKPVAHWKLLSTQSEPLGQDCELRLAAHRNALGEVATSAT